MIIDPLVDQPCFLDIEDAAARIDGICVRTPLLCCRALDDRLGFPVCIKPEVLQRTGSFKMRGAWNRISRIPEADRPRGVVAFSSGNHAQGVAESARILGVRATIVMPADAPAAKIEATRRRGAEVILYDRARDSREAIAARIAEEQGATVIRPFDDAWIMAGQGTAGLEIARDASAMGVGFGALICCASGGGLLAGIALAFETLSPGTRIFAAEPDGFDDLARSLVAGEIQTNPRTSGSLADALMSPSPGRLPFEIHKRRVEAGFTATDDQLLEAMAFAFQHMKLVVEPGGAAALAVLLNAPERFRELAPVCVILSGGNVDAGVFAQAIARAA